MLSRIGVSLLIFSAHAAAATNAAQITQCVSVDSASVIGNSSSMRPKISPDGRFVVFDSFASDLVSDDTNGTSDAFLRDRWTAITERVSVGDDGAQGDTASAKPAISADGRYVAFQSRATNLVPGDTNLLSDIFVRDRVRATTERVSLGDTGIEAAGDSFAPAISADGRYVAFQSYAANLVPGDTNGFADIFVHDRMNGTTERVSVSSEGVQADSTSAHATISADGRYVAFHSLATNLVAGDSNDATDVFVRDRWLGITERVSVASGGAQANSDSPFATISADGRFVAFESAASNLVAGDSNFTWDVFVHDRETGTTERVSVGPRGAQSDGASHTPFISADGSFVTFESDATNLVEGDTNGVTDVFVRDRMLGTTVRASVSSNGAQSNGESRNACISNSGRFIAFESDADDLVADDSNTHADVFVRDVDATGFASACWPGVDGVIACPCANDPRAPGSGCDNSSATGGAIVSASGVAYLSLDSLVFTTAGEPPNATSILLQGDAFAANGAVFGQGVRCASGVLLRLYTKHAVGGSVTAPELDLGDPSVSARSAELGDVIEAGQSRWYSVYYRDPNVVGACSTESTFNATQTGRVAWSD
jgi:Tol biopolymer transport system component